MRKPVVFFEKLFLSDTWPDNTKSFYPREKAQKRTNTLNNSIIMHWPFYIACAIQKTDVGHGKFNKQLMLFRCRYQRKIDASSVRLATRIIDDEVRVVIAGRECWQ